MLPGVGAGHRSGGLRDQADQPFPGAQTRPVDRFRLQADGAEQFQHFARAHDVARADVGGQFGGDQGDDLVEFRLRITGTRHDVAQPRKQPARSAEARVEARDILH